MTMTGDQHIALRKGINLAVFSLTALCTVITFALLLFILGYILYQGYTAINWAFFTELPKPVGEVGGGMAHAIVGTGKLLFVAAVIAFPIGLLGGVYLAEFGSGRIAYCIRYAADILNGVPSIVIGIFAYTFLVLPLKHFSTLAGGVALSIILMPIVLQGTEAFLRLVPTSLREAGLALGMSPARVILTVVIPSASRGIVTAMMLGIARVAGETAPLLFTAFGNHHWSSGWIEPTASLPTMIYTYAISPYPDWQRQAWAAGSVLLILVFVTNLASRLLLRPRGKTS